MKVLAELGVSLLVSTYWDNLLLVISPASEIYGVKLARPKGVYYQDPFIRVACWDTVIDFVHHDLPKDEKVALNLKADAEIFAFKSVHYTGNVNTREVAGDFIASAGLSCVATLSAVYHLIPIWKPSWITRVVPEDRCHVNGIALDKKGELAYVTALGRGNARSSWRDDPLAGVLVDVTKQSVVASCLAMPHSPRLWNGDLWFCNSVAGTLVRCQPGVYRKEVVYNAGAYTRGLAFYDHYAFVGISRMRYSQNQWVDGGGRVGVAIVDLTSGREIEFIALKCSEIFDVQVLPYCNPLVAGIDSSVIEKILSVPDSIFDEV